MIGLAYRCICASLARVSRPCGMSMLALIDKVKPQEAHPSS
jgi:hypothetical protein